MRERSTNRMQQGQRPGFALLQAMLLVAVMTLGLAASISYTQSANRASKKISFETQAYNVARGGLVDAIAWFKRQKSQPVEEFTPIYRTDNVLKGDTNDPSKIDPGGEGAGKEHLGLVQEFEIDKEQGIWGRYEVGKITKLSRDSKGQLRDYTIRELVSGKKEWKTIEQANSDLYEGVEDLTEEYGLQGKGLLWRIRSHGYVYRKKATDTTTHFYQYPNEVLDQVELDTEIFRLQIKDYGAAIVGNKGEDIKLHASGGISGGEGYALMWNLGKPDPDVPNSLFTSTQSSAYHNRAAASEPANTLDFFEVFGVSDGSVIANLADSRGTDHNALSGAPMSIVYIRPPAGQAVEFHDERWGKGLGHRSVQGGGILVVEGDMLVENWSTNNWTGVIYVTGNLTVKSLSNFVGETIVKGKIDWRPTDIEYNPAILATVRTRLAQYRERRAPIKVSSED